LLNGLQNSYEGSYSRKIILRFFSLEKKEGSISIEKQDNKRQKKNKYQLASIKSFQSTPELRYMET